MKELLNIKAAIVVSFLLLFGYTINSQSYINVSGNFNYWKHTELFGPGIGLAIAISIINLLILSIMILVMELSIDLRIYLKSIMISGVLSLSNKIKANGMII